MWIQVNLRKKKSCLLTAVTSTFLLMEQRYLGTLTHCTGKRDEIDIYKSS